MGLTVTARSIPGTLRQEVSRHRDVHDEDARDGAVVVVDVDRHSAEIPLLRLRVADEGRRDARGQSRREQLVGRGPGVAAAEAYRLVGDEAVASVDDDLSEEQLQRLEKVAAGCPLRRSLESGIECHELVELRRDGDTVAEVP